MSLQVTGDTTPKRLSPDLVRRILVAYGEYELAADESLVQEMVHAASGRGEETVAADDNHQSNNDNENPKYHTKFNVHALAEALTYDVRDLYDIRNEVRMTTNFDDVYITEETIRAKEEEMFATATTDSELLKAHKETQEFREKLAVSENLEHVNTIPWIDITAGTYRSKGLTVLLWATILITYFA